jgi:hypothetical protein
LRKIITDATVAIALPKLESPRRRIVRDKEAVTIQAQGDVIGVDILCLLAVEKLLLAEEKPKSREEVAKEAIQISFSETAKRFAEAKDVYLHEDDLFTDKESLALSLTTHFKNIELIGAALGVSGSTISRLIQPVQRRLGLSSNSIEANRDLLLIAIAAGIAPKDHIPKGMTKVFSLKDKLELARLYNPDLEERAKYLKANPSKSRFSRMNYKLGEDGDWHKTLLYGVRDGIVLLPSIEDIRSRIP